MTKDKGEPVDLEEEGPEDVDITPPTPPEEMKQVPTQTKDSPNKEVSFEEFTKIMQEAIADLAERTTTLEIKLKGHRHDETGKPNLPL